MIMTFDFIMDARRDEVLMNKIKEHIFSEKDGEVCTEIYRLSFTISIIIDKRLKNILLMPKKIYNTFKNIIAFIKLN